jgi:mono/diheme cytochrome c family protein
VHCHGITGDGLGPTAAFLNPYPRDYRPGVFKFKSTERADKPTHADLVRILHNGIPGSSMPSFALLPPVQVDALAEYVKYLAMRGETELALMRAFFELDDEDQGKLPEAREFLVAETLEPIAARWRDADAARIPVPEMPAGIDLAASIAKGKELFYGDKANCVKCHGITALGDGQANDYDDWNKAIVEVGKEVASGKEKASETQTASLSPEQMAQHKADVAWLEKFDRVLEGDALRPRTIDLYYRIHAGIYGAPMPAAAGTVPPEDIWHIVNYVLSLPYQFDGELGADRAVAARSKF